MKIHYPQTLRWWLNSSLGAAENLEGPAFLDWSPYSWGKELKRDRTTGEASYLTLSTGSVMEKNNQ